jgi:putative phosphoribosyl transferase
LPLGIFGASTGAAAALRLAAGAQARVRAVVSRGGRPDLAGNATLARVGVPTLLIVGGRDAEVIDINEAAFHKLGGSRRLKIVPGATHLFDEPGTLEQVAALTADWFGRYLAARVPIAAAVEQP